MTRNHGGRQAGVLCQGKAVIVLAGSDSKPSDLQVVPMLPQSWYVIEPHVWHAVVQLPGTIAAWAEASDIVEEHHQLNENQFALMARLSSCVFR